MCEYNNLNSLVSKGHKTPVFPPPPITTISTTTTTTAAASQRVIPTQLLQIRIFIIYDGETGVIRI